MTDIDTVGVPDDVVRHAGARWFVEALQARREVTPAEVEANFTPEFVELATAAGLAAGITKMAVGLKVVEPITVEPDDTVRIPLSATGRYAPFRVRVGRSGELLAFLDFGPVEIEGVALDAKHPGALSDHERSAVYAVFDEAYVDGDHAYLGEQLARLGTIALASTDAGLVGFALSDARVVDLPGLPGQVIRTAGLACVSSTVKRQGIGARLESLAMTGGDVPASQHTLLTSRFAHPAGLHHLRNVAGLVPRVGHAATEWQRDVAAGVAAALGVESFDRTTFVCHGPGRPVGQNVIDVDVSDEERAFFANVDRSRGDTLLGVWWNTPPPGWDD